MWSHTDPSQCKDFNVVKGKVYNAHMRISHISMPLVQKTFCPPGNVYTCRTKYNSCQTII